MGSAQMQANERMSIKNKSNIVRYRVCRSMTEKQNDASPFFVFFLMIFSGIGFFFRKSLWYVWKRVKNQYFVCKLIKQSAREKPPAHIKSHFKMDLYCYAGNKI